MTKAERNVIIKRMIRTHTKAITASKADARTALIGEGIYTSDGKLHPDYGGKRPPQLKAATGR